MKLIILLLLTNAAFAQFKITGNDAAIMGLQFTAGYAQGWREEVLYHPNALFINHPNLNRRFWDNRIQSPCGFLNMEWNADHLLKSIVTTSHIAAIVIKIGGEKKNWKQYAVDAVKYYGSYKLGFFVSYNLTHKNKFKL
jgi:hypothetical protein